MEELLKKWAEWRRECSNNPRQGRDIDSFTDFMDWLNFNL